MKLSHFLLLLTFLFSYISFGQTINQVDKQGKKQGVWKKYYDKSGRLLYEGTFKDDKPSGIFRFYYENGSKKALIDHNLSTGRSLANYFHPNGQLMSGGIFRNQLKDSTWVTFTEGGLVSEISNFQNDELHGPKTTFYISGLENATGRIPYIKSNYKNGKLDGDYTELFMDGRKKLYSFYIDGKLNGLYIEYHRNGKKSSLTRYKNGIKNGYCSGYDETEKEIATAYFYKGRLLVGKELEKHLNYCKSKGIDPNN
jgi:antitoxin component YwqK of YwqJK toxin-antitoxin module